MSQYQGIKPAGQPRSLRSIAQSQNSSALFTLGDGVSSDVLDQPVAHDVAEAARPSEAQARRGLTVADPSPFINLRG